MKLSEYPKITVILRDFTYAQTMMIIGILSGFSNKIAVEITSNSQDFLKIIEDSSKQFGDRIFIGAGTILNYSQAYDAIKAGAKFMLSPQGFSQEIFALAKETGTLTIPAAMTPSEILAMFAAGAELVKVFPAVTVGPSYFKQLTGPFGQQGLMAVGGVSLQNISDFLANGVQYFGIGSAMFNARDAEMENVKSLKAAVENYLQILKKGQKCD